MIANARRVILAADRLKLARRAPVRIATLSQIQVFVTDRLPSPRLRAICDAAGVQLVEVMPEAPGEPVNGEVGSARV